MLLVLKAPLLGHPAGERVEMDDQAAKALIASGQAAELDPNDVANQLAAKAMGAATDKIAASIDAVVNQALKQFADAQTLSHKGAAAKIFGEQGQGNPKSTFGDWLLHVAKNDEAYLEKTYGSTRQKAAMAESSGTTGGYLVPPQFSEQLGALIAENAIIRPRAFVQPMAGATLMFPYLDVTTAQSAGTSPFFGGVIMNWTEEAQTRTETEPAFKQMELKAHELSGYAVSSNVLLQDAFFGLEKFLMKLFSQAIAWYEDYAFLQGNGVGKPIGIINAKAFTTVTRAGANKIAYSDVASMMSKFLPASQKRGCWVCNVNALGQLLQMADAANRVVWIPVSGGAQMGAPGNLLGLPVYFTEKLPALGTAGDIILVDPSLYVIGDRMMIEIAASEHVNFLKNQMTWRVVERVDGQPWLDNVITLQDGSTTVSPFVGLHA